MIYSAQKLKEAILFNSQETLPSETTSLDLEIANLVNFANQSGEPICHYIGFEISGLIHLGTGLMAALKIKKLQEAGVKCCIYFANYHTWLNNKLDGKIDTISKFKEVYFEPVFKECCQIMDCDVESIEFIDATSLYSSKKDGKQYWDYMMKVAKNLTLSRVTKSVTITGKQAGEGVEFGILSYPVMQVADCFFMQTHLVHAGMDQRKCHVLMREVAGSLDEGFELKLGGNKVKPIAIHHKLLLGLGVNSSEAQKRMTADEAGESLKMSKSKSGSAIWVHDDLAQIQQKLKKAYCPLPGSTFEVDKNATDYLQKLEEEQSFNPILNWLENLVFPSGQKIVLDRPEKFGGYAEYTDFTALKKDYLDSKIHPMDLKNGLANCLNNWLKPVQSWLKENPKGLEMLTEMGK